jgi:hypothetical protein
VRYNCCKLICTCTPPQSLSIANTAAAMMSHRYMQIMAAMGMYVFANCFGYPDLNDMPSCNSDLTEHKLLDHMSKSASTKRAKKDKCYVSTSKQCALKELPPRDPFRLLLSTARSSASSSGGGSSSSQQQKQMLYVEPMLRSLAIMQSLGGIAKLSRVKPIIGDCRTYVITVVTAWLMLAGCRYLACAAYYYYKPCTNMCTKCSTSMIIARRPAVAYSVASYCYRHQIV